MQNTVWILSVGGGAIALLGMLYLAYDQYLCEKEQATVADLVEFSDQLQIEHREYGMDVRSQPVPAGAEVNGVRLAVIDDIMMSAGEAALLDNLKLKARLVKAANAAAAQRKPYKITAIVLSIAGAAINLAGTALQY